MSDDRIDDSPIVSRDFDRGFVQMNCNQRKLGCGYTLPHYHCQICGTQVNDDDLTLREFHPCCSYECILIYNQ